MKDQDTELERDIGYALSQSPFKTKGQRIESLRLVAGGVVAHLRRAGWLFALKPPEPLHGPTTATAMPGNTDPSATGDSPCTAIPNRTVAEAAVNAAPEAKSSD